MSSNHAYNVIIVPADHSGTRQYTVTRRLLWTTIFLLVLLAATMGFFVYVFGHAEPRQTVRKFRAYDWSSDGRQATTQLHR